MKKNIMIGNIKDKNICFKETVEYTFEEEYRLLIENINEFKIGKYNDFYYIYSFTNPRKINKMIDKYIGGENTLYYLLEYNVIVVKGFNNLKELIYILERDRWYNAGFTFNSEVEEREFIQNYSHSMIKKLNTFS